MSVHVFEYCGSTLVCVCVLLCVGVCLRLCVRLSVCFLCGGAKVYYYMHWYVG